MTICGVNCYHGLNEKFLFPFRICFLEIIKYTQFNTGEQVEYKNYATWTILLKNCLQILFYYLSVLTHFFKTTFVFFPQFFLCSLTLKSRHNLIFSHLKFLSLINLDKYHVKIVLITL